eukprot:scaffold16647_cov41-Attheya_sp.AAC.1
MCRAHNVAADGITIWCRTLGGGLLEVPPVVAAGDLYTTMIHSLLYYMCDCYDEDSGEHWKPNLTHVELHTRLWFVNCVDNLGGDKESLSLASLVGTVMEYNPVFIFQVLTPEKKGNWFHQHCDFVAWRRHQFEESRRAPPGSFLDDVPHL